MFSAFSNSGFDKIIDQFSKPKKTTFLKWNNDQTQKSSTAAPKEIPNPVETAMEITIETTYKTDESLELDFSQGKLQEAIIWSEILGKPVSKRRKRREL